MTRSVLLFLIFLSAALAAAAQVPTATPTPDNDVVRISTNLIQLYVSVTDKKGNPVGDLKPEEMEIYENGKRQKLSNFSFVRGARIVEREKDDKTPAPAVDLPQRPVRPESVRRTIALVVDDLNLSFESTFGIRQALRKFVDEQMQEGDLVAIIRTGAGVGTLQQFTTDRRQLLAAIERVKFNLGGTARISAFNPINQSHKEQLSGTTDSRGNVRDYSQDVERDQAFEREQGEFRENIFASGTLGALNFVVRGMKDLPGRKSIMLLSDGIRLVTRDDRGVPQLSRIHDSLRRLIDLANRASVVFYTLDARGLVIPGFTAQDEAPDEAVLEARVNELRDTQDGLHYLAKQTGGFAIINQNDISRGIRRVLDDRSYYLVGYEPDDDTFDPKTRRFNKIEVKVTRPDVRVRYRSGFFGIADENIKRPVLDAKNSLLNALTSPFAINDVAVRMNALFVGDAKRDLFVRAFVNVDSSDVTFTKQADGKYKASFDLVALTFGDNGTVLDERSKNYTLTVSESEYQRLLTRGIISSFSVPVKKPGGYQVRLAFRDSASGKVGSANQFIDVPNLEKKRLTVSGAVLVNVPLDKYRNLASLSKDEGIIDPLFDTSVRQFKAGSMLQFDYEIYNPKVDTAGKVNLAYKLTLYRDGAVVYEGPQRPIASAEIESANTVSTAGKLQLGTALAPGDYALRVEVIDLSAKGKHNAADQFIQFEIMR